MMGSGVLQKKAAVVPTNSPAMDIQVRFSCTARVARAVLTPSCVPSHLIPRNPPPPPPKYKQAPYNIERILHLLARQEQENAGGAPTVDGAGIRALMATFYRGDPMVIPPSIMGACVWAGVRACCVCTHLSIILALTPHDTRA